MDLDMTPYTTDTALNGEAALYDLRAVCKHVGSLDGGHYTAVTRIGGTSEQWAHFNDELAVPCDVKDVVTKNAYMLFYERKR